MCVVTVVTVSTRKNFFLINQTSKEDIASHLFTYRLERELEWKLRTLMEISSCNQGRRGWKKDDAVRTSACGRTCGGAVWVSISARSGCSKVSSIPVNFCEVSKIGPSRGRVVETRVMSCRMPRENKRILHRFRQKILASNRYRQSACEGAREETRTD